MDTYALEQIQEHLKYAFKWMARAADLAKQGEFSGATYAMTVAQQHWNNCQHERDKYIDEDEAEKIHWDFITAKALELAHKELKDEQENA